MPKYILKFVLPLLLLASVLLVFIPYFTSSFFYLRQEKENEENYQKLLEEQLVRKEKERKMERRIYLTGHFDPAEREDFVLILPQYTLGGENQNKMYLRKETYEAYLRMQEAARLDSVDLKIASAARNFDYQKNLWNNKWSGITLVDGQNLTESIPDGLERFRKILKYSAVPGTSRHHFGTDIDINSALPAYFNSPKGVKEYDWLVKNAYKFGFCQTYNLKGSMRPTGYNEEKWHWSYLPLGRVFTEEYKNLIKEENIKGFSGDEYVPNFNLIEDYVLSINPDCL